jgi:hypothetical protein
MSQKKLSPQKVDVYISVFELKSHFELFSFRKHKLTATVYSNDGNNGTEKVENMEFYKLGTTEHVESCNKHRVRFATTFSFHFDPNNDKKLMFRLHAHGKDDEAVTLANAGNYLAEMFVDLGRIVHAGTLTDDMKTREGHSYCRIMLHAEPVSENTDVVHLELAAKDLPKKDIGLFAKSDPYFILERQYMLVEYHDVYRSEVIKRTLNPHWEPMTISLDKLCACDYEQIFKIVVYDWDEFTDGDMIGYVSTCLRQIEECAKDGTTLGLKDDRTGKPAGHLIVKNFVIAKEA